MSERQFIEYLKELNISLTEKQLIQLDKYYNLLVDWNNKINLTTITERNEVYLKHFYDSLTLVKAVDLSMVNSLCDFGTGAGFPGLVLKIAFPNLKVTLIDSQLKRIKFLNEVIKELELEGIKTIHTRIEDYKDEQYDVITCRAVSKLDNLISYIKPKIKGKTIFIAMKASVTEELNNTKDKLVRYGLVIKKNILFELPLENSIRTLLVIARKN